MIADADMLAAVEAQRAAALATMGYVHAHPELGHHEFECSAHVAAVLQRAGFDVQRDLAGLPTAFRARLAGSRPGRTVGIVCLYDAVPAVRPNGGIEPVHSCGHGPIAGGVVGAALALGALRGELAGTIEVVGCPADEIHAPGTVSRGGGKLLTAESGVWDGVDAALYAHPEFNDTVSLRSLWMRRLRARAVGARSLRPGVAQAPLDALRAALALELPPDRVLLEHAELDGDVEEGSGLALQARFLVFGDDEDEVAEHERALREAVPGAEWEQGPLVAGIRPDESVTRAVADAFRAAGQEFLADPPPLPFATDFGNVSRRCPAALIGVGRPGGWAFHTDDGAEQFASADGEAAALAIARVLALAAARLTEPIRS